MVPKESILFVANVAKEHIIKFHYPTMAAFKKAGWTVDVACNVDAPIEIADHVFNCVWNRSPFSFNTIRGINQLKEILRRNHYTVIYCHTPVGGLVGRLAAKHARNNGTKVIYFTHGFHFYRGAPFINWVLYYPIEKLLAIFTDVIFTINDEDYNRAKRSFSVPSVFQFPGIGVNFERISVDNIRQVRDKYREEFGVENGEILMIYVAELIKNKNQVMLLNALEILNRSVKSKLLLVGPDHWDGYLQERSKEMGLSENVFFTGWRTDIGNLMVASDYCVASSIREGFGLNLVEAMYCGLPVIANKNRGHETVIENGNNGFLVHNAEELAERVIYLENNPKIRQQMAHIDVSKYDAKKIADDIVHTVQMITARG